jgi:hypothetical protein
MMLALAVTAAAAFVPPPLPLSPPVAASLARQAVGVAAASLPAAAHALEGDGINGAIKRTFAEFLGPYADAAPIVGTLVFVGICTPPPIPCPTRAPH